MNKKIITRPSFNPRVPEIYQLEAHSACNLHCPFCPKFVPEKERDNFALDPKLAQIIAERDLAGSYFVEFQLSGEPTLNKKLGDCIEPFLGKVVTGLSTHGLLMYKHTDILLKLDYLTISVDSVDNYENVRVGGKFDDLVDQIDLFMAEKQNQKSKVLIDLQIIQLENSIIDNNWERQVVLLQNLIDAHKWDAKIRTIQDCAVQLYNKEEIAVASKELCLNPWLSVTVHSDGDVVPCCFAFGKEVVYGNLNDASLEEIWNESPERKELQQQHLSGDLCNMCLNCTARSPTLLHQSIYNSMFKRLKEIR